MMKTEIAQEVSLQLNEVMAKLNDSVRFVQENCSEEEFVSYRSGIARVLGALAIDVMMPLYAAHPEVEPENLSDTSSRKHHG